MSKGSSYWSTARGKIGNTVVSIVRGQRIEKAYQPVVNNPKTDAQMKQRARFANVVKFYKNATNQFFKFAFEDRKQTESEFNAFMRWNTNAKASILKYAQVKGNYPAVGNNYILTAGSLGEIAYSRGNNSILYLALPSLVATKGNIGELSTALMSDYGLEAGDIVTIVRVSTSVTSLTQTNPAALPKWTIKQFNVQPSSIAQLATVDAELSMTSGQGLYLDSVQRNAAYWYAVIFSRQTTTGLKVSTSPLTGNIIATSLYSAALSIAWISEALTTWGSKGEAILQGALVTKSSAGVIETIGGDVVPRVSETTLSTGVSSSAAVTGQNLKSISASDFSGVGISNIEWVASTDTEGTITITGKGDFPNAWILYFGEQVIAQHSQSNIVITSVVPSSVDVLGAGDSSSVLLKGTNLDLLTIADLTVSDSNLSVVLSSNTAGSGTSRSMTITASAEVSAATITYNGQVIFEIKEVGVKITSAKQTLDTSGDHNVTILGEGLASIDANSFTVIEDGGIKFGDQLIIDWDGSNWKGSLKSYTAESDGNSATLVVTVDSSLGF